MGRITVPLYTPRYIPRGDERAIISTVKGDIVVEFEGKNAPLTVGNFVELAHKGFYDNLKFHAYQANSVILGGCPFTRSLGPAQVDAAVRGVLRGIHPGTGDARYTIKDEYLYKIPNHHERGSICLAHKSEPHTGSSQFYFSLSEQPEFDDKFVVFGKTVQGIEVVEALRVGDAITKITLENVDEKMLKAASSSEVIPGDD